MLNANNPSHWRPAASRGLLIQDPLREPTSNGDPTLNGHNIDWIRGHGGRDKRTSIEGRHGDQMFQRSRVFQRNLVKFSVGATVEWKRACGEGALISIME